jgi:hypothetical protein
LSYSLHVGQLAYQIEEHKPKLDAIVKESEKLFKQVIQLEKKIDNLRNQHQDTTVEYVDLMEQLKSTLGEDKFNQVYSNPNILPSDNKEYKDVQQLIAIGTKYESLNTEIKNKTDEKGLLESQSQEKYDEYKKLEALISEKQALVIENDQNRLGAGHWLNPKTILQGHTQWASKNDFRELSQKMFEAEGKQDMICSEFSAKSIVSAIDQLNKLTSFDLQAAGIINKEEQIIKEPISKRENFTNLHPERLADILEKSGCATKVVNSNLKDLIQLENTDKSKPKAIDYVTELPKKLYSILKDSKSEAEFKDKATKTTEIYLKAAKVEHAIVDKAKSEVLGDQLDKIYQQHTKQPKGILEKIKNACIKVLEFCKLRTKDKTAKKNLDNMVKDISKNEGQENIKVNKKADPALNKEEQAKLEAKSIGNSLRHSSSLLLSANSSNSKSSSRVIPSNRQQSSDISR